jgi:hypothetical protein
MEEAAQTTTEAMAALEQHHQLAGLVLLMLAVVVAEAQANLEQEAPGALEAEALVILVQVKLLTLVAKILEAAEAAQKVLAAQADQVSSSSE